MSDANLIEIFCILDEFCKYFTPELKKHTLDTCGKRRRNRPCLMSDSEVMTILVLFHTMHHRDLKSQPPVPHVRQRGDDHSRTLPYHAPARPQVVLPRLCMQPHAQGVSTPPVVQPLRRTSG